MWLTEVVMPDGTVSAIEIEDVNAIICERARKAGSVDGTVAA